jgi:hypothetical protein
MNILFVAIDSGSNFARDVSWRGSDDEYKKLLRSPVGLIPICGVPLIDLWLHQFRSISKNEVFIVTQEKYGTQFESWAISRHIPFRNVITIADEHSASHGLSAMLHAIEVQKAQFRDKNLLVIQADTICGESFDPTPLFEIGHGISRVLTRGFVNFDENADVFSLTGPTVNLLHQFVLNHEGGLPFSTRIDFLKWLVSSAEIELHTVSADHLFKLVSVSEYHNALQHYEESLFAKVSKLPLYVNVKCPARAGLLGNPSDGFNGKTLSFVVNNFCAAVTIESLLPQPGAPFAVEFIPHSVFDRMKFDSLDNVLSESLLNVTLLLRY